jgi:hypothetical protein
VKHGCAEMEETRSNDVEFIPEAMDDQTKTKVNRKEIRRMKKKTRKIDQRVIG